MPHIMDDVLEPPSSDDLVLIDLAPGVIGDKAWLAGLSRPGLLVVHYVRNLIIVRSGTVLFDVIASCVQWFHIVVRKN